MAIVDEQKRSALVEKALEAINETEADKSLRICRDIVDFIASSCNQNQKEIAQELQLLAKSLETISSESEAFEFKQKTCAIMLEINMEERRKARIHGQGSQLPQNSEETNQNNQMPEEKTQQAEPEQKPISQEPLPLPQPNPQPQPQRSTGGDSAPPRNKIIGLPSQTSVPQAPGSTSSSSFFSSKIIGASPAPPVIPAEQSSDIIGSTTSPETVESVVTPGVESEPVGTKEHLPFKKLSYLYLGTDDYEATVSYYLDVLKAEQVWDFDRFGARVTALQVSTGPLILVSDHRKAPGCQPVFEVEDLANTVRELKERGWSEQAGPFGTPNGEAYSFQDPSGNSFAIFQIDPDSTDRSYVDPTEY